TPLLEELADHPLVKRIRCLGTVAAFELDAGESSYLNPIGKQLQRHCLAQGVFIRPLGNVVYLLPPLCISEAQLQQCYGAIRSGIDAMAL
ncbi:MAG: aminotransferase class III-fold pyridoxal phosphate-dependent enzyme, partial [Vulcanococcus sp.]